MKEIDLTSILNELKRGSKAGVERATILQEVIDKIQERMDELARIEAEKAAEESEDEYRLDADGTISNFKDMVGPLGEGGYEQSRKELAAEAGEDFWLV